MKKWNPEPVQQDVDCIGARVFEVKLDEGLRINIDEMTGIAEITVEGRMINVANELQAIEQKVLAAMGMAAAHDVVSSIEASLDRSTLIQAFQSHLIRR